MTASTQAAQHGLSEHSHGYGVPVQTRSERFSSTKLSDFDSVSKREETWRYFDLEKLAGLDQPDLAEFSGDIGLSEATGITASWVGPEHKFFGAAGTPEDQPSAAAWQSASQAYLVEFAPESNYEGLSTLNIESTSSEAEALHLIVRAGAGSKAAIVINHVGKANLGENVEVVVEDNASLTLISVQNWNKGTTHLSSHFIKIGRNASVKHIVVTLGGDVVRLNPSAVFAGVGGSADLYGLYFADAGQYQEHRLFVDHAVANCRSRVTYKGALQGEKAHTVWVGDVLIRAAAEGTDTYELNRNLLLTDGARADSVPNLEIETGQIEGAGHASASGRFDDDQLFYLQSRGISEQEARQLVVRGFLNEVIQQIGDEALATQLTAAVEAKLERSGS
jgi:Fe-S cluster assembly protein SufD